MAPFPPDKLLTSHEVGELLQMDPSSIVKWVNDGLLPAYRTPGGHRRIKTTELLSFLRQHGMFIPPELAPGLLKVLIVDDDPQLLSAFQRSMKSYKDRVEVHTASSGIEALLQVGRLRPDALVIDVNMPDLNGLEVCEKLKNTPETKDLLIVMVTGRPTVEMEKKALTAGARALRGKPISAGGLMELLTSGAQVQAAT